ncbi:type III secretion system export apparatus subunit SctV [Paraburkholderia sediminicola]|uniref:type III secretion system export apparatus subunit SctV n=1 Tax=Paraburkholderia sediminicola TaxID=458836 RepID=UPI0038B7D8FD
MDSLSVWLSRVSGRHDIVLSCVLMVAIGMLILPLPTIAMDFFIAINLTFAIVLITTILYIREPLELSAFPSLLLITTLFRLGLTVSTSRLILLQHDAGQIVYAFGDFVVGGNLTVGILIFAIVTIVQFIVITKGAERVAEVGARFSLDGMPGKQMSIDNDLRSNLIDAVEAQRRRVMVQKESQLFGAMDGAMKFVKGDAIASIVVIFVNLIAGVIIGVFQENMPLDVALRTYALLSVGDGLVAQIPAIIISVASGLIVTRIPGEQRHNLADDLVAQLRERPTALYISCGVVALCGILPGFPLVIFFVLSAMLGGIGWSARRKGRRSIEEAGGTDAGSEGAGNIKTVVYPLSLRLASRSAHIDKLTVLIDNLRAEKFMELGLALKEIRFETDPSLKDGTVKFMVYDEVVCTVAMQEDLHLLVSPWPEDISVIRTERLAFGDTIYWVDASVAKALASIGVITAEAEQRIVYLVSLLIDRFAQEFVGIQETYYLINSLEGSFPEVVKELQRQVPMPKISEVLQRLVREKVSVRNLRAVFEALIEWAPREKDVIMLSEYVRLALRRVIVNRCKGNSDVLRVWIVGKSIENMLRESVRQTGAGAYSALSQAENNRIIGAIVETIKGREGKNAVLVTAIDTRRFLRKLIEHDFFWLPVLSTPEIGDDGRYEILGNIELVEGGDATL